MELMKFSLFNFNKKSTLSALITKYLMREIYLAFKKFVIYRFNLHEDSEDNQLTIEAIKKNVEFRGANLWTLIFAIFIASIGLNVNSTAVIIGAMLVSPLMGPIMGVGLGIGINDFDLVKKGVRNLGIATIISIATSSLYFWITPLHDASSEILARTSPSIWDVFIAGLGGLAGIVAATRKEKSNAIPGVAIATALMPPLCTAGYGLASGNLYFFIGAMYLYFINSIFICVATFVIVRFLKFPKKEFQDKAYEKKVRRYIWFIVIITTAPSIYLAYQIVDKSIFENNAEAFVQKEMNFNNTQVISKNYSYSRNGRKIDLLLLGTELSKAQIDSLKSKLPTYQLNQTELNIRQGLNAKNEIDLSQIKASILETVNKNNQGLVKSSSNYTKIDAPIPEIKDELKSLYPQLSEYSISHVLVHKLDTSKVDTITMMITRFAKPISTTEQQRMAFWLKNRLLVDSLKVIVQTK
jgi:uncharacterized hydrophobic protein (TIGR00271 family)